MTKELRPLHGVRSALRSAKRSAKGLGTLVSIWLNRVIGYISLFQVSGQTSVKLQSISNVESPSIAFDFNRTRLLAIRARGQEPLNLRH